MERITFEGNFCDISKCRVTDDEECPFGTCSQRQVWERLKQYEDTGLTPEEVSLYAKARAEGRVLELPCQVGATVYELRYKFKSNTGRRHDVSMTGCGYLERFFTDKRYEVYIAPKNCTKSDMNWLGKTVFLTEEEAITALEEMKNA